MGLVINWELRGKFRVYSSLPRVLVESGPFSPAEENSIWDSIIPIVEGVLSPSIPCVINLGGEIKLVRYFIGDLPGQERYEVDLRSPYINDVNVRPNGPALRSIYGVDEEKNVSHLIPCFNMERPVLLNFLNLQT